MRHQNGRARASPSFDTEQVNSCPPSEIADYRTMRGLEPTKKFWSSGGIGRCRYVVLCFSRSFSVHTARKLSQVSTHTPSDMADLFSAILDEPVLPYLPLLHHPLDRRR